MTGAGGDAFSPRENASSTQCSGRPEHYEPAGAIHSGGVPVNGHADLVSRRCLLVDDNQTFLEVARAFLDRQGVTVAGTASSTAEALRQARALRPDLVLVDIALGDESGFDLARCLAGNGPAGNSIAVIMMSSAAEADYVDLIAESPASGFLPKAELSAAGIRRIIDNAKGRT